MKVTILLLCFTFGIFENVHSDAPKADANALEAADPKADLNERAGLPRPNPLNMVVCYACTNCKDVTPYTNNKLCPYTPDPYKQGKCVSYVERFGVQPKDLVYIRGCASDRGTCEEIKRAHEQAGKYAQLVSCKECQGDKCNSAPKSMVDLTVAFITIAILPVIGKCTLS